MQKDKNLTNAKHVSFDSLMPIYAKVHTCDFGAERALTPGDGFYVTELDTACGLVRVGAMICYDREFPESARILMLKGAELIPVSYTHLRFCFKRDWTAR